MAKDLNKVILTGRLGKEVEQRITPNGVAVATFSVASGRRVKDGDNFKDQTEWFRVVAWDKLAETCSNFLKKGSHVCIEGRLQTREWVDQQGQKRFTTEVIATDMYILDTRRDDHEGHGTNGRAAEGVFEEDLEPEAIPF